MKIFPDTWQLKELKSVCSEIVDCVNKTAPAVDYSTEYKMIRTTNVRNGRIILDDMKCVDENTFTKWTRRLIPRKNDVVLTREAPLGEVGLIRSDDKVFLGQRTMIYRANGEDLIQRYLYYSLLSYPLQSQIASLGSGSTVEHLRVPHAEKLKIPLPPKRIQRKIAAILSAYDDLIENNKHRIAILQKMVEELYNELFVRLRFPGHKNVKIFKGVPEGWLKVKIKDVSSIIKRGVSPIYDDNSSHLVINQKCIRNGMIDFSLARGHSTTIPNEKVLRKGDVLINSTGVGTLGRISICWLSEREITVDSHITICRANMHKIDVNYFGHTISRLQDYFEYMATGATGQVELNRDIISSVTLLIPPKEIQIAFSKAAEVLITKKEILLESNTKLKLSRDRLLSRLMSGKLDVENLDIYFPKSMEESVA